jgi:hypothetical protein
MSAYVVFTHILWRRRVIKGSIGVESLVNHMRPDPGRPFMRLPPFNPAAVSVLYTFLRFAAHGFGDFCRSHPFFTQGDDAGTVESGGTALVNPLRLCGLDAGALPIADEAKLHLGDHAQHGQDHPAHRAAGIDGRLQHSKACAFFFQFVHEVENVPGRPAQGPT